MDIRSSPVSLPRTSTVVTSVKPAAKGHQAHKCFQASDQRMKLTSRETAGRFTSTRKVTFCSNCASALPDDMSTSVTLATQQTGSSRSVTRRPSLLSSAEQRALDSAEDKRLGRQIGR